MRYEGQYKGSFAVGRRDVACFQESFRLRMLFDSAQHDWNVCKGNPRGFKGHKTNSTGLKHGLASRVEEPLQVRPQLDLRQAKPGPNPENGILLFPTLWK